MLHLVLYGVLAVVVGGVLFALAARFLPAGEQIAPPVRDEPPWELPADRAMHAADIDAVRLPVALRGYRFAETDQLLDRLAGELRARDAEIARLRSEGSVAEQPASEDLEPAGEELPFEEAAVAEAVTQNEHVDDSTTADDGGFGAVVLVKSAAFEKEERAADEDVPAADEATPVMDAAAPDEDEPVPAAADVPAEEPARIDEDVSIDELFAPSEGEEEPTQAEEGVAPADQEASVESPTSVESVLPQALVLQPPEVEQTEPARANAANAELDEAFPLPPSKPVGRRRRGRHAATPPVEVAPVEDAAPADDGEAPPDISTPGTDDELADSLAVNEALEESAAPPPTVDLPAAPADEAPAEPEPVVEEPVAEEPVAEEPVAEEPVAEAPSAEAPPAEAPPAEQSIVDEAAAAQPVAQYSAPPPAQFAPPPWSPAAQHPGHWTVSAPPWAVAPAPGLTHSAPPVPPPPAQPAENSPPPDQPTDGRKRGRRRRKRS